MVNVVHRECITNALYANDYLRTFSSLELSWGQHAWEVLQEVWLERDAATLEAMMEVSDPLTWGQLEGLGAPS